MSHNPDHYEGETTPPTNLNNQSDPAQQSNSAQYANYWQAQPEQPEHTSRRGIIVLSVLAVLLLGGLALFFFQDREPEDTAEFATVTVTETEAQEQYDVAEDEYLDPVSDLPRFNMQMEHIADRKLGLDGAQKVRAAFISRIAELAEDPSTPETMPDEIDDVDAGPLGMFSCSVAMSEDEERGTWDCRGPEGTQAAFFPILLGGIGDAQPQGSAVNLLAQGTPADPDWKARAIEEHTRLEARS